MRWRTSSGGKPSSGPLSPVPRLPHPNFVPHFGQLFPLPPGACVAILVGLEELAALGPVSAVLHQALERPLRRLLALLRRERCKCGYTAALSPHRRARAPCKPHRAGPCITAPRTVPWTGTAPIVSARSSRGLPCSGERGARRAGRGAGRRGVRGLSLRVCIHAPHPYAVASAARRA